ncbi:MAG: isoprenylcysteine carboxylmethyltransferase family protein [Euryarchaeota archaeon]|nr:isoprenylcysteine carboxylmethyltransferase family protein [Euryarchaeota archaeon]
MYATLALLFLLFALVHSLTAAGFFKRRVGAALGLKGAAYRLAYNLLSVLSALPFAAYWLATREETPVLFSLPGLAALPLVLLKLAGAVIILASVVQTGARGFLGLEEERDRLVTSGLYARVRHPMYLGALLFIWATPELRALDALLYTLATLYLAFGIWIEERRLLARHGSAYEDYRSRVPAIFPRLRRR